MHLWERSAEKKAEKRDADAPQNPTDDVVSQKFPVRHLCNPSENRHKCSDDGNEASDDNGARTVLFIKIVRLFQVFLFEKS